MDLRSNEVEAVLQAGGKGTRLLPATEGLPKPLVQVGGVPIIETLFRQMIGCGIRRFTVITGWLGERIEQHLLSLGDIPSDVRLTVIRESRPMGNIGSLARLAAARKPVLFAFGDLITDLDFAELVCMHRKLRAQATLTSHYETHQLTLGELLVCDGYVTDYQEKPVKHFLICSGIAVFEPEVLDLIDPNRPSGISDLIKAALAHSFKVAHWTHGAFWVDVNDRDALRRAETELSRRERSLRAPRLI